MVNNRETMYKIHIKDCMTKLKIFSTLMNKKISTMSSKESLVWCHICPQNIYGQDQKKYVSRHFKRSWIKVRILALQGSRNNLKSMSAGLDKVTKRIKLRVKEQLHTYMKCWYMLEVAWQIKWENKVELQKLAMQMGKKWILTSYHTSIWIPTEWGISMSKAKLYNFSVKI